MRLARGRHQVLHLFRDRGRAVQRPSRALVERTQVVAGLLIAIDPHVPGLAADAKRTAQLGYVDSALLAIPALFPFQDELHALFHRIALFPGHDPASRPGLTAMSLGNPPPLSGMSVIQSVRDVSNLDRGPPCAFYLTSARICRIYAKSSKAGEVASAMRKGRKGAQ